jgi:hypothetical protein
MNLETRIQRQSGSVSWTNRGWLELVTATGVPITIVNLFELQHVRSGPGNFVQLYYRDRVNPITIDLSDPQSVADVMTALHGALWGST